jgi:hypothetical protein
MSQENVEIVRAAWRWRATSTTTEAKALEAAGLRE